jgi:TPP-dependent pyruvate/acetoin dehydrogenase alpha subunit
MGNGIFGATSMLGATLPVAAGMAFKFKARGEDSVAVAFYGEAPAAAATSTRR